MRHHFSDFNPVGELKHILADCELSEWARWLVTSTHLGARETLLFLEHASNHLPRSSRLRLIRRLNTANSVNVDALLHQLLVYEVCYRFDLRPDFEPYIDGQTPDLALLIAGQRYIADVFLTNRPKKTLIDGGGWSGFRDSGEAARKIADTVSEKAVRYGRLKIPLVLFVSVGYDVAEHDVETALYGASVYELSLANGLTTNCHEEWHVHGAFCPPGPTARHRTVSAVIRCDWFDTLARERPGRRLHCVVYHHWEPDVALPAGSFGRFQDVRWQRGEPNLFVPIISGTPNLVMGTTSREGQEWATYSADKPW